MFGFGKNEHIKLFPEGIGKVGRHDEEEREKRDLKKLAKDNFLQSLSLYILDLEQNGLVEKGSETTGATISFAPEKLAKLGMKDDEGKPVLDVKDVLEILGVDDETLKTKEPIVLNSSDKEYRFYRYPTKEPFLSFVKEAKLSDPIRVRHYFQLTEEELKEIYERLEMDKIARANIKPPTPPASSLEYRNMTDMVNEAHSPDPAAEEMTPEVMDSLRKQIDES